jgi:RNA polymerase sigma-70 factor (ECF subfamily)
MVDESTMLEKMRAGDDSALAFFMRQYMQLLYYRALAIIHDKMAAEDIVQEVFIRFWDQRGHLQDSSTVPAYLTRLVRNACINHLEHRDVRRRHAASYQQWLLPCDDVQPWDEDELEQTRQRLNEFIQALPGRCREIFVMACVEGVRYHEVAARLDVSVNTVKSQVKSAYARLRKDFNIDDQELLLVVLLSCYFS